MLEKGRKQSTSNDRNGCVIKFDKQDEPERVFGLRGYDFPLGGVPIDGINVLCASIAEQDRLIVGRESQGSAIAPSRRKVFHICHLFQLPVANSYPDDCILLPIIQ